MYWIDLRQAVEGTATNFRAQLFRLLLKADKENRNKLRMIYPVETKMAELYQSWPYHNVHFPDIEQQARTLCAEGE